MNIKDIFIFSGRPVFDSMKSTSNLVQPSYERFIEGVLSSARSRQLSGGPQVESFERELATAHGTDHCVAFCSGLWGMVLTIKELALPGRSEVVMPAMTYRRLADITAWLNLTAHFCDVDPQMLGATPELSEPCINENTALLLIAQPIVKIVDMPGFEQLGEKHGIPVLFDSVEAGIGTHSGRRIGSFGEAECFSMHASKLINGFEAGYTTTNNAALAARLRVLRNDGLDSAGTVVELGLNARLCEIHACMGLVGLRELPEQISLNKKRYEAYRDLFKDIQGASIVAYDEDGERAYKNILMELEDTWPLSREETLLLMHQDNMLARPYYHPPLHTKETAYQTISGPIHNADCVSSRYVLMPSGEFVSISDVAVIADYVNLLSTHSETIIARIRQ